MFARTYAPAQVPEAVKAWQGDLQAKKRAKVAAAIADPSANPELFEEGWEEALQREAGAPAPEATLTNGDADSGGLLPFLLVKTPAHDITPLGSEEDEEESS